MNIQTKIQQITVITLALLVAIFSVGCGVTTAPSVPTPIPPSSTPIPPANTPTPIPPTPTPQTRLEVRSLPPGSEVFVASVEELKLNLRDNGKQDVTTRQLLGFNRLSGEDAFQAFTGVTNDKYQIDVAPASIPLKPGVYIVFLSIPTSVRVPSDANTLDWFEEDSTFGMSITGFSNGRDGRAYVVEIVEGEAEYLTQLWQSRGASLEDIEKIYPDKETFKFDEAKIKDALTDNIPKSDLPTILRLLRKGGKVAYREDKNHRILIELNPDTGKLDTLLRYED